MATSYEFFIDPGTATFETIASEVASFTGARLAPTTSGSGRPAFEVFLPDRNCFLEQSTLPGARERLAAEGPQRADFMAWSEPGQHHFFEPSDHDFHEYRGYRVWLSLDVYFEEDTPLMRDYARAVFEQCAARWPTIVMYNEMDILWAIGEPGQPIQVATELRDFVGPKVIGDAGPQSAPAHEGLSPEHWC